MIDDRSSSGFWWGITAEHRGERVRIEAVDLPDVRYLAIARPFALFVDRGHDLIQIRPIGERSGACCQPQGMLPRAGPEFIRGNEANGGRDVACYQKLFAPRSPLNELGESALCISHGD